MNLENKLEGFPHVYYFNMDEETDRREYMESQFENYCINYTRISSNRFNARNPLEWIDVVKDGKDVLRQFDGMAPRILANFVSHIIFLKEWYENTDEDLMILMEDDYDLSLIDYWHFDWNYFMSRVPFDWDTIQLGYEHFERVEFFLSHKDYRSFNFGPTLINRNHISKILNLFIPDNLIELQTHQHYCGDCTCTQLNTQPCFNFSVDTSINHVGKNYTVPLITTNTELFQEDNSSDVFRRHHINRHIYHYWWKNKRDQFSLDDFFRMNKSKDNEMTEYLHNHASRAFSF